MPSYYVHRTYGYRGNININGQPRNRKLFLKKLSYIMQEDLLQPHLTVLESMEIASKLRNCTIKLDIYNQILVRYEYDICLPKIYLYTSIY